MLFQMLLRVIYSVQQCKNAVVRGEMAFLSDSVTAIDTEIRSGDISSSITEQESHSTHQIFGTSHFTLRDQTRPLGCELGVVIENLLCAEILLDQIEKTAHFKLTEQ